MNIIELEDLVKGLPDDRLFQEAQAPSGEIPQFLTISEIQRRTDMRKRWEAQQQQPQGTIADQVMQQGIASMQPQQPQMQPQMQQPQQMAGGGIVRMREGGETPLYQRAFPERYWDPVWKFGEDLFSRPFYLKRHLDNLGGIGNSINFAVGDAMDWIPDVAADAGQRLAYSAGASDDPVRAAVEASSVTDRPLGGTAGGSTGVMQPQGRGAERQGTPEDDLNAGVGSLAGDFVGPPVSQSQRAYGPETESEAALREYREANQGTIVPDRSGLAEEWLKQKAGTTAIYEDMAKAHRDSFEGYDDLIDEKRKDAWAQAMIQMGAGIAGDDLAGGISRAGILGLRSKEDAQRLSLQERQARQQNEAQARELELQGFLAGQQIDRDVLGLKSQTAGDVAQAERDQRMFNLEGLSQQAALELRRIGMEAERAIQEGRNFNEQLRFLSQMIQLTVEGAMGPDAKEKAFREALSMIPKDVAERLFSEGYLKQFGGQGDTSGAVNFNDLRR